MQNIKKEKSKQISKKLLIILSLPLFLVAFYYINLLGIYFGSTLKRIISGVIC